MKTHPFHRPERIGFTLVELLIVVAIIGILVGILSSAIMKLTTSAVDKRNKNNAERLQAAIVEYWHDMGRLPLESPEVRIYRNNSDGLEYKAWYCSKNDAVVKALVDATLPDGKKKCFLDLHGFQTPNNPGTGWPCPEVSDAYNVSRGEAVDDDGRKIAKRPYPVLAYFTKFVTCPECGKRWIAKPEATCSAKYGGCGHAFSTAEVNAAVSGAMPFVIELDLDNDMVLVRNNPEEALSLIAQGL